MFSNNQRYFPFSPPENKLDGNWVWVNKGIMRWRRFLDTRMILFLQLGVSKEFSIWSYFKMINFHYRHFFLGFSIRLASHKRWANDSANWHE